LDSVLLAVVRFPHFSEDLVRALEDIKKNATEDIIDCNRFFEKKFFGRFGGGRREEREEAIVSNSLHSTYVVFFYDLDIHFYPGTMANTPSPATVPQIFVTG